MKPSAYIAGKITGERDSEVYDKFFKKEDELKSKGYRVINPVLLIAQINSYLNAYKFAPLIDQNDHDREAIMQICKRALVRCECLVLLPDYDKSKGAMEELDYVKKHGLKIIYP